MNSKKATKTAIKKAAYEIAPEGKFHVEAQGTTESVEYLARQRMGMGIEKRFTTKMTANGRYRITCWGKAAEAKTLKIAEGLTAAGYIVENITLDSLEVHNGTVVELDGILRWEGTY